MAALDLHPVSTRESMEGFTCIVTGATSGIGRETALEFARRGARVGIVARDSERARTTAGVLEQAGGEAIVFLGDLGSRSDVRRVAREIIEKCPRIDVLVNNAGVVNLRRSMTVDGIEVMFAVNHLAYFALTLLLLDRLVESAPARVINVASEAHRLAPGIRFDDPGFEHGWATMRVYGHSKLANILFTRELVRRISGLGVTANCLHPGAVATGLGRNNGKIAQGLIRLLSPFFRTPAAGASTSIRLATASDLADVSGGYFADGREKRPSAAALDEIAAGRLWELSELLTGVRLDSQGRVHA